MQANKQFRFSPSPEQLSILSKFNDTADNIAIQAVAGSGKTSTLELITSTMSQEQLEKTCYLTFSKKMVNAVRPKLPLPLEVRTFHSFGYQAIRSKYGSVRVDEFKYLNLIRQLLASQGLQDLEKLQDFQLKRLIEYIRLTRYKHDENNPNHILDIIEFLDFEYVGTADQLADFVKKVIYTAISETSTIDLADQLFYPAIGMGFLPHYETFLIDECQDLNSCMLSMLSRAVSRGSRVIIVGDPLQAIFGFMGADFSSFDRAMHAIGVDTPQTLSTCYRCFDEVLKVASNYTNIVGTGKEGTLSELSNYQLIKESRAGDLVLCRKNAPLMSLACQYLSQGIKAYVEGRDFGNYLATYANKVAKLGFAFDDFLIGINQVISEKIKKTRNKDKVELLGDVLDCLDKLYNETEADNFKDFINFINSLFGESSQLDLSQFIVLSSIHKSKGLEANRVFWLQLNELYGPGYEQESNLEYVALTRAKDEFYFVKAY